MSQTIRFIQLGVHGTVRQNFNWPAIKSRASVVQITVAEIKPRDPSVIDAHQREPGEPAQNFIYHLGDANVVARFLQRIQPEASKGSLTYVHRPMWILFVLQLMDLLRD
jgi:hypothetical protein